MYPKVINPKKHGKTTYNNTGSCAPFLKYLAKEDKERGINMEHYFSATKDFVSPGEVMMAIDNNHRQLSKCDAKFFTLVLAPTPEEMLHLNNNVQELKEYTRDVMDIYARTFKDKNGISKNLRGTDLIYFAKVEYNRSFDGKHKDVLSGKRKSGEKKPGAQFHVHIIVSRKDNQNKQKISPLANDKNLFHRKAFKLNSCLHFDKKYNYEGAAEELIQHIKEKPSKNDMVYFKNLFDPPLLATLTSESSEEQAEEIQNKESIAKKKKRRLGL